MNKRSKEKRFLDEDDLIGINCTFKDIRHELKEIRNDFDNTFKLMKAEFKHSREVTDSKIDSLKWVLGFLVAGIVAILIKLFV
jgi:hypothetical protein